MSEIVMKYTLTFTVKGFKGIYIPYIYKLKLKSLLLSYIYIYTYAKLLTCIVCSRSSFTGVKRLLWFI